MRVDREEPATAAWFGDSYDTIPRPVDEGAIWHCVYEGGHGIPAGFIECSDGSVFVIDEIFGSSDWIG